MSQETIIGTGAEAILLRKDNAVIKDRIKKSYRLLALDEKIRKSRTRSESKILEKASKLIPVPKIIHSDNKEKIEMQFINGKKLSEHLDALPNAKQICIIIGKQIAMLHDNNIIHGDLTTSNMIYIPKDNPSDTEAQEKIIQKNPSTKKADNINNNQRDSGKLYFIDFGLGFISSRTEDKAVDLHLIKEAFEAKHFSHSSEFFSAVLNGYKSSKDYSKVSERLKKVESRGRYKQSY